MAAALCEDDVLRGTTNVLMTMQSSVQTKSSAEHCAADAHRRSSTCVRVLDTVRINATLKTRVLCGKH